MMPSILVAFFVNSEDSLSIFHTPLKRNVSFFLLSSPYPRWPSVSYILPYVRFDSQKGFFTVSARFLSSLSPFWTRFLRITQYEGKEINIWCWVSWIFYVTLKTRGSCSIGRGTIFHRRRVVSGCTGNCLVESFDAIQKTIFVRHKCLYKNWTF